MTMYSCSALLGVKVLSPDPQQWAGAYSHSRAVGSTAQPANTVQLAAMSATHQDCASMLISLPVTLLTTAQLPLTLERASGGDSMVVGEGSNHKPDLHA